MHAAKPTSDSCLDDPLAFFSRKPLRFDFILFSAQIINVAPNIREKKKNNKKKKKRRFGLQENEEYKTELGPRGNHFS